jgi:hypothetical protein
VPFKFEKLEIRQAMRKAIAARKAWLRQESGLYEVEDDD